MATLDLDHHYQLPQAATINPFHVTDSDEVCDMGVMVKKKDGGFGKKKIWNGEEGVRYGRKYTFTFVYFSKGKININKK